MLRLQYFFFFEYIDWEGVLSGCFNPRLQVTQPVLMRFVSHCTTPPSVLPLHSPSVKRRCSAQPCDFFAGWSVRRSNMHPTYQHVALTPAVFFLFSTFLCLQSVDHEHNLSSEIHSRTCSFTAAQLKRDIHYFKPVFVTFFCYNVRLTFETFFRFLRGPLPC